MIFHPDLPEHFRVGLAVMSPGPELAARIEAACAAYPEAWRPLLTRMCARYSVDVLADVDAVLALAAEARR